MSSFNQGVPTVPTLINSSNCIVLGNTSSGTALTVQQLGAGAVMNVATSTGSSALFVSSTGQVGVGTASPLALFHSNVNTTAGVPDAIIGNHVIKSYNVSLALAATSFSNICTITASSGNGVVYLDVVQNETGAGSAISYTVPMTYQATGNAWRLLLPMNIANLNTPNYAQVLFKQTYNEATFALYRPALATSGTANFTCTFRVSQNQANPVTFADKTDTTTLAAITTLYQYTQLTQTATGVGIGVTGPSYQLDLSTDGARKLTSTTWLTGSDQRIKTDIQSANLQMCYDTVKSIDLKYFKWNFPTDSNVVPDDKHSLGFIAQEVKTVFPNAVSESNSYGYSDFLSLNTDQILKAMYGALKQTMADKEALEQSLSSLEQRLAAAGL